MAGSTKKNCTKYSDGREVHAYLLSISFLPPPAPAAMPPPVFGPAPPPAPPANQPPQPPAPLHPAAFLGATILCHGFVNAYPLPRLPAFPLVITATTTAPPRQPRTFYPSFPLLAWHPAPLPDTPPPPPPTPVSSPEHPSPVKERLPARGRRMPSRLALPRREPSSCLAAKEKPTFITMAAKATQLKTLKNTLSSCSRDLQDQVAKHGLLRKKKKPLGGTDLCKFAAAAGIGPAASAQLDLVLQSKE